MLGRMFADPGISSVASTYHDGNEKTTNRLIEEIRARRDWLGIDFLDEDEGDEEDDEIADADERANEVGGDGTIKRKVVKLLDYACGPGMVSRVRPLSCMPSVRRISDSDRHLRLMYHRRWVLTSLMAW